jgi:poly [ADP-ribose] polymerase
MLWHGTRIFNVLSILKSGLLLPKTLSTMQIAGAMFGNGLYFSDQSSKSLNYSRGYWDGGPRDRNCFMLLVDVALGSSYIPKGSYETLPKAGHDSTFAKPGVSGILNNEYIVYRPSQANIKYLVEFEEK